MKGMQAEEDWTVVIKPTRSWFDLDLKGLWQYRDLVRLLVRRDLVAVYKQTALGPLWHVIQPLLTTLTLTFVFGFVARLSPDGVPPLLFYMSGVVPWTYFTSVINKTSKTFIGQSNIMSKVYFPRLAVPLSVAISNLIGFIIQLLTFVGFLLYYHFSVDGFSWHIGVELLMFPVLIATMALLGLSVGIIVSAMTTRYRDLTFLIGFLVQMLMYISPVILPRELFERNEWALLAFKSNPMTPIIDNLRAIFLGGAFDWNGMMYAISFSLVLAVLGILVFNRVERSFADIV